MKYAQLIRDFLSALFGSKLVVELRHELSERTQERDYFRGRLERIELAQQMAREKPVMVVPREKRDMSPVAGHKSWRQIQREHTQKTVAALQEEEERKAKEKAN